ncbi:AsmA family protein [Rhizobium sp. DBTS2]|uniref:AsmA family protein n=1 Tax=Mycoplana rhizolycopersici TaxID=2746702 RepID=A0ABX2QJB3_9HYPH|nr:AsmA family protein [Rhizobium rhizolycopersici]NVP56414.1 AsmA family protein [Rhizobium rhizolycopersici]
MAVGGLVVLALFAALLAPYFIDWTGFRQDFEREASRIVGRKVVVHGTVDARLIPFPSVTLHDVRVGEEEEGAEPIVTIDRFSMDAELAPFLSGEALIFDMRIDGPKVRLTLLSDGTLDWARGRRSDIPAKTVVLENVSVTGGEIEFVDEQAGRTRRLADLNAQMSARSLTGPWRIDGRGTLDGNPGAFQVSTGQLDERGTLKVKTRIVPDQIAFSADLDGDLKVVDFKPQYGGTFVLSEKRPANENPQPNALRINGDFELSNERVRVPKYELAAGDPSDPYIVTGEATLDTGKSPEFLLIADGQQIDVSRIGRNGEQGKTGRNAEVSARQRLNNLLSILADIPIPQVPGRASLKLPAIVIGDTTVREVLLDVEPDGDGWKVARGTAQFPGRTAVDAKGRLTLKGHRAFNGDLLVASNQPSGLAAWLAGSVDPEIRRLRSAGFAAEVELTDELQRFEKLEIAAGGASLTGRIERESRAGEAPTLSVELAGNSVEIETLRALTGLIAGEASADTLLRHSIAVALKADRFTAFGEEAEGVDAKLSLRNGELDVNRLDVASLAGAAVSVRGQIGGTLATPSAGLDLMLRAGQMRPVLELLSRHLPSYPVLARLVTGAGYYDDADLKVTLALPGDRSGPLGLIVAGTANGGSVDARISAANFGDFLDGANIEGQATLANPRTVVLAGQLGLQPLPFDGEADGVVAVKFSQPKTGPGDLSFAFTAGSTSIAIDGNAELSAERFLQGNLAISVESADLEPYLLMNDIVLPQTGAGLPVALRARAAIGGDAIQLTDIGGTVDRNGVSGKLRIDRTAAMPKATGALAFDTLDLAWLAEGILGPIESADGNGFSAEAVASPARENAEVNVQLTAARFWTGFYGPVENFAAKLAWTGGDIALDDVGGDWLGGKLGGRFKLSNAGTTGLLETRLTLSGADVSQMVWSAAGIPVAEGRGDVTLALDASGESAASMIAAASGSGEVRLNGLKLRGLRSDGFGAILAAADATEGDITESRSEAIAREETLGGDVLLGAVNIPFTIASGKLRADAVTGTDGAATFSGAVEINLADRMLAGQLGMRLRAGEEAMAGGEPEVTLFFDGPIAAPRMRLDAQPLGNYLSLRRFERERRRVEILQASVLEKQRLRREAALYRSRAQERAAIAEAARLRAAEEERKRAEARRRAEQIRAEQAARAEAERRAAEQQRPVQPGDGFRVDPSEGVIREPLPPINGNNLNFDALPGVN